MQLHKDEIAVSGALIRTLVARFLPELVGWPLRRVTDAGTDHHLFRIGDAFVLRLPRRPGADAQIRREARWLPHLAPHLPLSIPEPLRYFAPSDLFGHGFGLYRWIAGESLVRASLSDPLEAAATLAGFVGALRAIDGGSPPPDAPRAGRGGALGSRDGDLHHALDALADEVDGKTCLGIWADCLAAAPHAGPTTWLHGDLIGGNLLVADGTLTAVIDFGGLGIGDPAADLIPAWALFDGVARQRFRQVLGVGDDEWRRGRGWALSFALIALPYYRDTHVALAATARQTLGAVMSDWRQTSQARTIRPARSSS